jgi:basic membrane lipoprotein Med (substrate-binding protein (PBP1-ABC) superfamily)
MSSTDTADDGTREAVKSKNKQYLGAYLDESDKLECCTISSIVVDFERAYDEIGRDYTADAFGKITTLDVANGGVRLATPFKHVDEGLQAEVEEVAEKIKAGEIEIDPKAMVEP